MNNLSIGSSTGESSTWNARGCEQGDGLENGSQAEQGGAIRAGESPQERRRETPKIGVQILSCAPVLSVGSSAVERRLSAGTCNVHEDAGIAWKGQIGGVVDGLQTIDDKAVADDPCHIPEVGCSIQPLRVISETKPGHAKKPFKNNEI